ncbi:sigma-70 family RNA polymerase sigma factor [Paenibacillus tarimensis]
MLEVNGVQFEYLKSVTGGLDKNAVLEDLMTVYGQDVWNFAFFQTGRREIADDVAQDVFVKVYERLYTYRGQASVKTWLLAITRNTARDAMRSAWMRRVRAMPAWFQRETYPSAEREVMDQLVTENIWAEVMSLPRKLREVLLLHIHHGLPLKEIAVLLEISEGTVKSRLHRARAAINRKLSAEGAEDGEGLT